MKKKSILIIVISIMFFISPGCFHNDEKKDIYVKGSGNIKSTNYIKKTKITGGCYSILSDEGRLYNPINLNDDMKIDGLKISFEGKLLSGMASACSGIIIQLTSIEKI